MAEEHEKPAASAVEAPCEVAVVESEAPPAEKSVTEKEAVPVPEPEPEPEAKPAVEVVEEAEKPAKAEEEVDPKIVAQSVSFKEESYVVGELPEPQKKALEELKQLIQEALNKHEFTAPPTPPPVKEEEKPAVEEEKKEEKKEEEKAAEPEAPAPVCEAEAPKTEDAPEASKCEEVKPEEEVKEEKIVVVTEVVETVTKVDDDGAKTVEAIEETIVAAVPTPAATEEPAKEAEAAVEATPPTEEPKKEAEGAPAAPPVEPEEVYVFGIPILGDERSDVILLKFLRARDFKVKDAFAMIKNTVKWRKEFGIDALLEEELGSHWEKVVFTHGVDKEGHPVCYNVFGEFQNKELYQNTFTDEEKRSKFIKWRIQFLEKSIRKFDFNPTGISTIVQVNDLKNSPGLFKREHNQVTNQALQLLQDNYPEFVAKQVFINVPWWYLAFNRMISPFLTQRTKSKFVFAGPSKSAETLFKYIVPEHVPVQYGGLSKEGECEFTTADPVTEVTVKPACKHTVEIPVSESGVLVWEVRALAWDVSYGAEFVPSAEDAYTIILQKTRKVAPSDEPVISNSFKIGEPGKVVLTIDNQSSKKKKLLYRSKTKPSSD
ncbi:putative cellular retinaldehyde binding/alpha-tocopherol transport, GOLD domain, CRAL/TRIO [Rosa chinensis]|uniref:Putative cellular retinaldehyde binding/alpha-tocopherol transport, GOLD domain, CRAL/TRIO n=1 Tax=Rosa chinensis TaxID=74649 RepID=A0A2P6PEN0_ROSCH|nr:patellin-3 [Rosa chinensis]PRQ20390.1 putative cellular retinaldehyde binding/alpha-tocopherol transport, GOLD domain, CRAL/TRIO [Rosa chinensis]